MGYRGVVILLSGQIGVGKTMLVNFLKENLPEGECYIGSEINFANPKECKLVTDFYTKNLNKLVFQIFMMASRVQALTHALAAFNKNKKTTRLVIFDRTFYCIKQFLTFPDFEKALKGQDGQGYEYAVDVAIKATEDFENCFEGLYPIHVFLDRSEEECKLRRAKRAETCPEYERVARTMEVDCLDLQKEGKPDIGQLLNDHLRATADKHIHVDMTGSMSAETIAAKMFDAICDELIV